MFTCPLNGAAAVLMSWSVGPHVRVWQKAGVAKTISDGLPEVIAWVIVRR